MRALHHTPLRYGVLAFGLCEGVLTVTGGRKNGNGR